MQFRDALKLALQSLGANKMRTILTVIGVVMGVGSIITLVTLVNGANRFVGSKLSGYGADVFSATRRPSVVFSADEYFLYQKRKILRMEDYEAVRDNCAQCSEVGASVSRTSNVVANDHSSDNTEIRGYTWNMLGLSNIDIAAGRGFTPADEQRATHNVVVGYDVVDNLMGQSDPIGKEVRVDGVPYTIIGVAERQGKVVSESLDNWVAIPVSTFEHVYGHNESVTIFARAIRGGSGMENAKDEVRVLMRSRRHVVLGHADDFEIESNDTFLDLWNSFSALFIWVMLSVASISLVVSGVIIMNIMLVTVTERTREIGVRKAVGARQCDVRVQFLVESALMALLGGAFGALGGITVGWLLSYFVGLPSSAPTWAILLSLLMAGSVGICSGVYPASKAARLDPIAALRSEV